MDYGYAIATIKQPLKTSYLDVKRFKRHFYEKLLASVVSIYNFFYKNYHYVVWKCCLLLNIFILVNVGQNKTNCKRIYIY